MEEQERDEDNITVIVEYPAVAIWIPALLMLFATVAIIIELS
jgi:hypothetical protein